MSGLEPTQRKIIVKKNVIVSSFFGLSLVLVACGDGSSDSSAVPDEQTTISATEGDSSTSDTDGEVVRLWIGAELVDCTGEAPQKCMLVAESENGDPEYFYDQIEGFTFVEGFDYVIDVAVEEVADPPADGSSLRYELIEVIEEVAAN